MRDILEELGEGNDPVRQVQKGMRTPLPRRFYKSVGVEPSASGFSVLLDGKSVRTPARKLLELPSEAAAQVIAGEFDAQKDEINPATMPATKLANTVIDGIMPDPQPILEDIVRFAASDLLCYRAQSPQDLVDEQASHWDPVIDWYRDTHGANFILAEGVMHVAQPREAMAVFASLASRHQDPFKLGCLHMMATLTGSAMLSIAVAEGFMTVEEAFAASNVDEDWNTRHWGEDAEAVQRRENRWREMEAAGRLFRAL
jgi:chaperone required for assembly of F1-ATPase